MRRIISIVFLSLLLLQAIPVLHFFSSQKAVFYSYVDEEKPEQKSKIEEEDFLKHFMVSTPAFLMDKGARVFRTFSESPHPSPLLEGLTPPPDACRSTPA